MERSVQQQQTLKQTWSCRSYNSCSFGMQLVAAYHCDQAYTFDVSASGSCTTAYSPAASIRAVARASDAQSDRGSDTCSEQISGRTSDSLSDTESQMVSKTRSDKSHQANSFQEHSLALIFS